MYLIGHNIDTAKSDHTQAPDVWHLLFTNAYITSDIRLQISYNVSLCV